MEEMVSIVIPTYNRKNEIIRAICSILQQTYVHYEIIVVDDGSTDNTQEAVRQIDDDRIRYIYLEQNQGACHARNVGIQESKYEYIAFQDSDDEWMPDKLELQMHKMMESPDDVGMVYCRMEGISRNGQENVICPPYEWPEDVPLEGNLFRLLLWRNIMGTPTMLIRKECLRQIGGFKDALQCLQDWELALRIAKRYRIGFVDEVLVKLHKTSNSISTNGGAHLVARCYMVSLYRKEMTETRLIDIIKEEILEKAKWHGIEREIEELLTRDFDL